MMATNLARVIEPASKVAPAASRTLGLVVVPQGAAAATPLPTLRVVPLITETQPRRFARLGPLRIAAC